MNFPKQLPDPENLYTQPASCSSSSEEEELPLLATPIQTFPQLFPEAFGGPFHPEEGVQLLMPDMIRLQLMYASRQVLSALCKEMGHAFLAQDSFLFQLGGVPGLYNELHLLSDMMNNIMIHALVFQNSDSSSLRIWVRFKECMQRYAPWCTLSDATAWKQESARLQGVLEDLSNLHLDYLEAKIRFQHSATQREQHNAFITQQQPPAAADSPPSCTACPSEQ